FRVLAAPTKRERRRLEEQLESDPRVAQLRAEYESGFTRQQLVHDRLFAYQVALVDEKSTGGDPDLAKLFLERVAQVGGPTVFIGLVVPSAFHANAGSTGIRRLYLEHLELQSCFSYENREEIFEIHRSFKFAT